MKNTNTIMSASYLASFRGSCMRAWEWGYKFSRGTLC